MTINVKLCIDFDMSDEIKTKQDEKAVQVGIKRIKGQDQWMIIELEDGNIIKFKPIVVKVMKLQTPNPFGEPQYAVISQTVAVVDNLARSELEAK